MTGVDVEAWELWRRNVAELAAGMASDATIDAVEGAADATDAMCDGLPPGGKDVRRLREAARLLAFDLRATVKHHRRLTRNLAAADRAAGRMLDGGRVDA